MKEEILQPPSRFIPRVDFHTHILPQVDDGSSSLEESVQMVQALAKSGVTCIALTPHFYPQYDDPERFLARRDRAFADLRSAVIADSDISHVHLIPGAEVEYFDGIACMKDYPGLKLGKTKCLLVEMPHGEWTSHMVDDILQLNNSGIFRVVIAHVERYLFSQKRDVIHTLIDDGVIMQSNTDFFIDRRTSGKAVRMLKKGLIHILGTDCHSMTMRPPSIQEACDIIIKRAGEDVLQGIMYRAHDLLVDDIQIVADSTSVQV